jgi:hypothetical protein
MAKRKLSNNKLIAVAIVALLVSVGGTWMTIGALTGRSAQDATGYGNLTISSLTAIQLNAGYQSIDLGAGNVDGWAAIGHVYTANATSAANCQGCNWTIQNNNANIQVVNTGNTYLNVTILSNTTAAALFGGTGPVLEYNVTEHNATACSAGTGSFAGGAFIPFSTTNKTHVCTKLCPANNDSLNISFHFGIPADAAAGAKTLNVTFYAAVA